jgi:hypothetical protein
MSAKELMEKVGTIAVISMEKIRIEVRITDARYNFGRTEYLVKPLAGAGEQWINSDRLCHP